jgi:hypothetical protein
VRAAGALSVRRSRGAVAEPGFFFVVVAIARANFIVLFAHNPNFRVPLTPLPESFWASSPPSSMRMHEKAPPERTRPLLAQPMLDIKSSKF